jgi:hypothetical protein
MNTSSKAARASFTLIEVLFAAALMLVTTAGMIDAVTAGWRMMDASRKLTLAQQIIQSEIVNLRLTTTNTLPTVGTTTVGSLALAANNATLQALTSGFTCTRKVEAISGLPTSILQVTYTVRWTSIDKNTTYTQNGVTYISKYGLGLTFQLQQS